MKRIADKLLRARKLYFTGREKEIAIFRQLINENPLTTNLLYIYGPAGQGKTTLVKEFMELCKDNGNNYVHLDGRDMAQNTGAVHQAFTTHFKVATFEEATEAIEQCQKTFVLLVDTYEKLVQLDDWMWQDFLPTLPTNALIVISSRKSPSTVWTNDEGWQQLMQVIQVRNFSKAESQAYLGKRDIPTDQYPAIIDFTHGHPLALSLVADLFAQHPNRHFSPEESPDMVQVLLGQFMQKAPSPAHKTALEVCAMAHVTSESLLASVMGLEDASELFDWLKNLSFIESDKWGLYPHDLARETLIADIKWRNPDWFKHLYKMAKSYYINKLGVSNGDEQRKYLFKLTYLHRRHPLVRQFFHWQESPEFRIDLMAEEDIEPLTELTRKYEGDESARAFLFWTRHPASHVWVWRSKKKAQSAFLMSININELDADDTKNIDDAIMLRVMDYSNQHFHLRKGEVCTVFRFWMTAEGYQDVSGLQSSIFLFILQYYLTTQGLAVHLLSVATPSYWKGFLNYSNLEHIPQLDYRTGNTKQGFYSHDWRIMPPKTWVELLGENDATEVEEMETERKTSPVIVLSESEFSSSVYDALKDYHSEKKLGNNPLTRSRLVVAEVGTNHHDGQHISVLRKKLDHAIQKIEQSPKDERYHRIIYRTFINPVGSQEQVAEFLSIPYSTYRRHLKKATELVCDTLWRQEVAV